MASRLPLVRNATTGVIEEMPPGDVVSPDRLSGSLPSSGSAVLDFGAAPGKSAVQVAVTGQTNILTGSSVQAWIAADSTADHNAQEHALGLITVAAGSIVAGTGFTIYARSLARLTGQFLVRWAWQ